MAPVVENNVGSAKFFNDATQEGRILLPTNTNFYLVFLEIPATRIDVEPNYSRMGPEISLPHLQ